MLTDLKVRNAKPKERPYKLADGGGLYLLVMPNGARYWRLKYRVDATGDGGRKRFSLLAPIPQCRCRDSKRRVRDGDSVSEEWIDGAREQARDKAKRALQEGADPSAEKQQRKREAKLAAGSTFLRHCDGVD